MMERGVRGVGEGGSGVWGCVGDPGVEELLLIDGWWSEVWGISGLSHCLSKRQ